MVVLTTFPPPEEGIQHKQENTQAHVAGKNMGNGTLFIAESRVSWVNGEGQGFSLEYPAISLHAVSRDLAAFPQECLYLMMDGNLDQVQEPNTEEMNGGSEEEEDSCSNVSEVRFVPNDNGKLKEMYDAMCTCQALHPDENDSISGEEEDEEGAGDYFDDPSGEVNLTEGGQAVLDRLEGVFDANTEPAVIQDPVVGGGNRALPQNGSGDTEESMEMGQFDDVEHADR